MEETEEKCLDTTHSWLDKDMESDKPVSVRKKVNTCQKCGLDRVKTAWSLKPPEMWLTHYFRDEKPVETTSPNFECNVEGEVEFTYLPNNTK